MSETVTDRDFPAEVLERAEYEISRYGEDGFFAMTNEVIMSHLDSPHADALMVGMDAIAWSNRIKYKAREKVLEGWRWVAEHDYGEKRPWFAMPDDPAEALAA